MTHAEEYAALLKWLPKDLTLDELARFRTTGYDFPNPSQTMVKVGAVCRDGQWFGVMIVIHSLGVAGHTVFPQGRQHKADAVAIAEKYVERVQDHHEARTGVRNRGVFDDDDDLEGACPPDQS